jgi:hypothetical protein
MMVTLQNDQPETSMSNIKNENFNLNRISPSSQDNTESDRNTIVRRETSNSSESNSGKVSLNYYQEINIY